MRKIIFGLICGAVATFSYADNCDNARNTYDDIYCTNKVYASADADLNKNYQQLRKQLNETQQKILKKSQLAWIRHRDAECTNDERSSVNVQCRLTTTQERNNWLQDRIRECQTIGCKTTRLSE
ncbi:lysozyme inhibitor LprI family protein [Acinetobacter colistiniresistens]|uniref:lysozyme inhibitor LprI family protein n=1 Tax=Acinetobacter colistiniresistens TaxID=280145 RepID=UPI00211C4722|nr:lysozyme inhibitor LprI family protein [Acinetobacter colistiniresistens]UUM27792.1 lysozyme inhibitor LprI family protein [Acinetobacter colistiniresistens]